MMKNNNQQNENTVEINPFLKPKNIQVLEDKDRNLAVLKIYGTIESPEEYIEELSSLEFLSKKYSVLEITLNSPGGSLNTTVDIVSVINNFECIITIGKGEVASAAFMLWTMGDIRIVTDYSMYMAHRESYGMYGKTSEHRDAAEIFGRVYEEMFEDCFGDLLTEKEKIIAERSETWISYKDLLDRNRVISYDTYINPPNPYSIAEMYVTDDGKIFILDLDSQSYKCVSMENTGEEISSMTDFLYGIAEIKKNTPPLKDTDMEIEELEAQKIKKTKKNVKSSEV